MSLVISAFNRIRLHRITVGVIHEDTADNGHVRSAPRSACLDWT